MSTVTTAQHVGHYGDYRLKQLVGKRRTATGITKVPTNIDQLFRNEVRIGMVARHTNAPLTLTQRLSPEEADDALKAVNAIRFHGGLFGPSDRVSMPPSSAAVANAVANLISKQSDEQEDSEEHDADGDFDAELNSELLDEL